MDIDGISVPDMEVSEADFYRADGLARLIDGAIFLGKTGAEKQAEANAKRAAEIEASLNRIDAKSARASRAVALAVSSGKAPDAADVRKLADLEAEASAPRTELQGIA